VKAAIVASRTPIRSKTDTASSREENSRAARPRLIWENVSSYSSIVTLKSGFTPPARSRTASSRLRQRSRHAEQAVLFLGSVGDRLFL
jgi:hypothetical protein